MELTGQRFSVISRITDSEAENRTPLTPYQPVSVIKNSLKSWVKSVRRSKHPKHIIVLEGKPITYKCTVCSATFKSKSNCCYHKHCGDEGEKPFACSFCDRKFSTKTHFSYHIMMHSDLNPHKCSICGKSFKTKYKLRRHQQMHTDTQKKFFCDVCGRAFLRKSSIHVHKQVHTGVKPYQCNECPKAFREKKNLIFHLSHHTGIKNWVCEICGRSYVLRRDLELHKRTHLRIRPFSCTISKCQQTFSQRRYLKRHMETHKCCVKFICNLCEKEFSRKDNLQRHIVNTHLESQNSNSSRAEKTKHILLDTAPYIKTVKMQDAMEKSDEVDPVQRQIPVVRTESVIVSTTRTDHIISVCSSQGGNSCNRISVIKTLADVAFEAHEGNNSEEFRNNDLEEYCRAYPSQFESDDVIRATSGEETYINCEQNSDCTSLRGLAVEPAHSDDTIHFISCPELNDGEPSHNLENDPCFTSVISSRCDVRNEVSLRCTNIEFRGTQSTFGNENDKYARDSTLPESFDLANRSADQYIPFVSTEQVNRDHLLLSHYDNEQFECIISKRRTSSCEVINNNQWVAHGGDNNHSFQIEQRCTEPESRMGRINYDIQPLENNDLSISSVDQNNSKRSQESLVLRHDFNSYNASFGEETSLQAVLEFNPCETNLREKERSSLRLIYHDLTNGLSVGVDSSSHPSYEFICSNENTTASLSSVIIDGEGEKETNSIASHFVPHFVPEKITPEIVKPRCMLPKKVIAASYRNCIDHEITNTRAGGLDATTRDSYKLLDLSMKSQ